MSKNETSIKQKIEKLNEAVEWFYGDDFTLDDAMERYQDSIALAKEIETDLKNLKNEIEVIDKDFSKA